MTRRFHLQINLATNRDRSRQPRLFSSCSSSADCRFSSILTVLAPPACGDRNLLIDLFAGSSHRSVTILGTRSDALR